MQLGGNEFGKLHVRIDEVFAGQAIEVGGQLFSGGPCQGGGNGFAVLFEDVSRD